MNDAGCERSVSTTELPTSVVTVRQKQESGARDFAVEKYNLVLSPSAPRRSLPRTR